MSFAHPLLLFLLVPVIATGLLLVLRRRRPGAGLPGDWGRIIEPALASYLAANLPARAAPAALLCTLAGCAIVFALARPMMTGPDDADPANFAGRVIVLSLAPGSDAGALRTTTQQLVDLAPRTPTALIVTGREAYPIVPLTVDTAQISRYLQVVSAPELPEQGHAPHEGIALAEEMLATAGVAVRQIVVVASMDPPKWRALAGSDSLRSLIGPSEWSDYAARYDAAHETAQDSVDRLHGAISDFKLQRMADAAHDLSPYFCGIAVLGWLGLFRRGGAA